MGLDRVRVAIRILAHGRAQRAELRPDRDDLWMPIGQPIEQAL
jgi:hypothetical protein